MALKVFLNLWHLLCCGRKSHSSERKREREREGGEGGGYSLCVEKIKPLQMEKKKKSKYSWILEMGEYGGSASAISASSPRPALKEKCLAADRHVHSPRVVSARILSGILMAQRVQQHSRIRALKAPKDLNPHEGPTATTSCRGGAIQKHCREGVGETMFVRKPKAEVWISEAGTH